MLMAEWNWDDALAVARESDKETRDEYEARLKARRDLAARVNYAYDEGVEKGRGEALAETARNLKSMGLSAEQIAAATGLNMEAIQRLQSNA